MSLIMSKPESVILKPRATQPYRPVVYSGRRKNKITRDYWDSQGAIEGASVWEELIGIPSTLP